MAGGDKSSGQNATFHGTRFQAGSRTHVGLHWAHCVCASHGSQHCYAHKAWKAGGKAHAIGDSAANCRAGYEDLQSSQTKRILAKGTQGWPALYKGGKISDFASSPSGSVGPVCRVSCPLQVGVQIVWCASPQVNSPLVPFGRSFRPAAPEFAPPILHHDYDF
jgi:hypothetical protein